METVKKNIKNEIRKGGIKIGKMEDEVVLLKTIKDLENRVDLEMEGEGWEGMLMKAILDGKKVLWWEKWEKEEEISKVSKEMFNVLHEAILELVKEGYELLICDGDSIWFKGIRYIGSMGGVVTEEATLKEMVG